jgi:hypothetical protein
MTGQEALTFVDTFLRSANHRQRLNDIQSEVFLQTWAGLSYKEIAQQLGYQHDYIKQVGSQLWRSLSQTLGEPVSKQNVKAVLRHYQQETCSFPNTRGISTMNGTFVQTLRLTEAQWATLNASATAPLASQIGNWV